MYFKRIKKHVLNRSLVFYILLSLCVFPLHGSLSIWNAKERVIVENYLTAFKEADRGRFFSPQYQKCIKEIEKAILAGEYVNERIELPTLSNFPIHWAIACGDVAHVVFLIEHGADLTVKDSKNRTPLHYALGMAKENIVKGDNPAFERMTQIAEKLLKVHAITQDSVRLLLIFPELLEKEAKKLSQEQLDELLSDAYFLLTRDGSPKKELLSRISQSAKVILKLGAKGQKPVIEDEKEVAMYPIHAAIHLRFKDHVELLINNDRKNVHHACVGNVSPLLYCLAKACSRKEKKLDYQTETEIAKYLIVHGADVLKKDDKSFAPIDFIVEFPEMSSWLTHSKKST